MIRIVLCGSLCALTVVVALATAAVQSGNRDRGIALDAVKRECDMLEAVNGDRCQRILAQDWKRLSVDEQDPKAKTGPNSEGKSPDRKDPRPRTQPGSELAAANGRRSNP